MKQLYRLFLLLISPFVTLAQANDDAAQIRNVIEAGTRAYLEVKPDVTR